MHQNILKLLKNRSEKMIILKKLWKKYGLLLILVIAATLLILSFINFINAKSIGEKAGVDVGNLVGSALGTFEGISQSPQAYADGKEEGLSAIDTNVKLIQDIISSESNKLEVLIAGISFENNHQVGDKYKALYYLAGDAVFTVDMTKLNISEDVEGKIHIEIPEPAVEVYIDDTKTEQLAEISNIFFDGSTEDGYVAYFNSMDQIQKKSIEEIENYTDLMKTAKDSAKSQIKNLYVSVYGKNSYSDDLITFSE